jgi:hypothetical protein
MAVFITITGALCVCSSGGDRTISKQNSRKNKESIFIQNNIHKFTPTYPLPFCNKTILLTKAAMRTPNAEKLYLDTEFTGLHQAAKLISLALVAENGRALYAEFTDFDKKSMSPWIQENVLDKLLLNGKEPPFKVEQDGILHVKGDRSFIKNELETFLSGFGAVEIWADVPHYDWVLFCELFGGAMGIPQNVFFICFDLATLLLEKGIDPGSKRSELVAERLGEIPLKHAPHNALYDAWVCKLCHEFLNTR